MITKLISRQRGIALMMVLSTIALLTVIMVSFSFDNKLNVINSNNMQNRAQAKLNAEAGLRWSLLMLNIYKELFNKIEVNENVKKVVPSSTLNTIWSTPFLYPIPTLPKASISQKETLTKFHNENFLNGQMNVSVRNLSGKINLNLLRFSIATVSAQGKLKDLYDGDYYEELEKNPTFAKRFKELLDRVIKDKIEQEDEDNSDLEEVDTEQLVNNIIYYTSDPVISTVAPCPRCADAGQEFNNAYLVAKKAPMTSITELYLIPGWTYRLVELIKNHVTVHGSMVVDVSQITAEILKLIMPPITDVEIQEFFEYKNNPDTLETFDNIEAIKRYFTANTSISGSEFDDRVDLLEKSGIVFGSAASLFEVKAVGEVDRSTYSITAIVSMPPLPKPKGGPPAANTGQTGGNLTPNPPIDPNNPNQGDQQVVPPKNEDQYEYPAQLLKPRVIHLSIN